jgi:thiamine pyrophosphokinase
LLNYAKVHRLEEYWKVKGLRISVDGGSNRLMETDLVPDLIVGDFDSIAKETVQHYEQKVRSPSSILC